jgi:hypothetical protein
VLIAISSISLDEDSFYNFTPSATDIDVGDTLLASSTRVISAPEQGSTSVNTANGIITYTPIADFNGADSFSYQVSDNQGALSNVATVNITVNALNDIPVLVNDIISTPEDTAVLIDVLANDSDIDTGDSISNLVIVTEPSKGTLSIIDAKVNYQPDSDYFGSDSFTYQAQDSTGALGIAATVFINISGSNDSPVAVNDSITTDEDVAVTIDVLNNDTDIEDGIDATTVTAIVQPGQGTISINSTTGEISYTPNADINGSDSFSYIVKDNQDATSNEAIVNISISAVNDAPVANDDSVADVQEDTVYPINVLGNDTDVEDNLDATTVSITAQPTQGSVTVDTITGMINYTPGNNFFGFDSFSYNVKDTGNTSSNIATVTLTIASVNDIPTASDDSYTMNEDSVSNFAVLNNDNDIDGTLDSTTLAISQSVNNGILTVNTDGSVDYRPNNNYVGSDSFTYTVQDNEDAESNAAVVTIIVNNVNDAPSINSTAITTVNEDEVYSYLIKSTDIDTGDSLTYSGTGIPSWLMLTDNGDGSASLTGTPDNEDLGVNNITLIVSDNDNATAEQSFAITVVNTNDIPEITGTPDLTVAEDSAYSFTPSVTDDDSDDTHTFSIVNQPGWASFDSVTGALTGTPTNNNVGITTNIVITVSDSSGATAQLTAFTITVTNTNDAPLITGTPATTVAEDSAYNFTPSVTDVDSGDIQTFSIVNSPDWASFDTVTGRLSGTPTNDNVGITENIVITVSDSSAATAQLTAFSITVTNTNDAPVITGTPATTVAEDSAYSFTPRVTDVDSDDIQTFSIVNSPGWASFDTATGRLSGTPTNDNVGITESIVITVSDSSGATAQLTAFTITVTNTNDAPVAVDDSITLTFSEDGRYLINVLDNDSDIDDGDSLTVINASASIGSVSVENNQLVYLSLAGVQSGIELEYVISDGHLENGTARATVDLFIEADINEELPVITLPADIDMNATGLFTKIDLGVATALDSTGQQIPASLVDSITLFEPGSHLVYWQAQDSQGLETIAAQKVTVHPLITISNNAQTAEGTSHSIKVYLNGTAPSYPVVIPFTVSGSSDVSDHNLVSGEVVIDQGHSGVIEFNVIKDNISEDNENLIISLDNSVNLGSKSVYTLDILEENIAPQISFSVTQNNEQRFLIESNAEQVIIVSQAVDANVNDTHIYNWDDSETGLIDLDSDETTYTFDTTGLTSGIKKIHLTVTDNAEIPLSTSVDIYLEVVDSLVTLTNDEDSDGDLIPDAQEGYGDADSDGIPDYLDNISNCNVMPQQLNDDTGFLIESEAGVCLRKGSTIANNETGGIQLQIHELLPDDEATNVGGLFDFIAYNLPLAGQSFNLVLPQRLPIPENAIYRKLKPDVGWVEFVVDANNTVSSTAGEFGFCPPPGDAIWEEGLTAGHWCVQITVQDGGANDDDGLANNSIVDPSGVAVWVSDNNFPEAVGESVTMPWNSEITLDVLENDSDSDGDNLTLTSARVDFGVVEIQSGKLVYTPSLNFFGIALINYTITDGNGGTGFALVTINVLENKAPVANDDRATTDDHTAINIDVLVNDSDKEGDNLTIISANAEKGLVTISDNQLHYTPLKGFIGVDIIHYTIDDGKHNGTAGQVSAKVSVTIKAHQSTVTVRNSSGGVGTGILIIASMLFIFRRYRKNRGLANTT